MQTQPIDLRLPRRPLSPPEPLRPEFASGHEARDEAFALASEPAERRDATSTDRLAEALRNQLRDLRDQQQAIAKLLDGLGSQDQRH